MISRFSNNITQANTLKINNRIQPKNTAHNQNNSNPSFKGLFGVSSAFLNFLNTNPAIGACFVDLGFMVTPRTWVDMGRSKNAGVETLVREASGTTNHAFVGADGLLAAALVSAAFNKANGVKANKMFMDGEAIDVLSSIIKNSQTDRGYNEKLYWNTFFKDIKGLNTTEGGSAWKTLSDKAVDKAVTIMTEVGAQSYDIPKDKKKEIAEIILKDIGAGETFRLEKEIERDGKKVSAVTEGSFKNLLENANSILKAVKDKAKNEKSFVVKNLPDFLNAIKKQKLATVAAGLAIPVAIGVSAQPLNRYYTKKRTGEDGFVGVKGRKPDHSKEFKILKTSAGLLIGSAMIASILKRPQDLYLKTGSAAKEIISKLQFKGVVPTINQFKFIYGMTIMSRLLAARDKNELRECTIKDTLGFANWLILGGIVSKGALKLFEKMKLFNGSLINYDAKENGLSLWNKITRSVEKSHEEILYPVLDKLGINVVENGKKISFTKLVSMMKEAAKSPDIDKDMVKLIKETSKKIKYKNTAQILGYIYSGLVLGIGIPKLNIAITKHYDKKHSDQDDKMSKMRVPEMHIKPESKTFSAFGAYLQ